MKVLSIAFSAMVAILISAESTQARESHECIVVKRASTITKMPQELDEIEQRIWAANTGQMVGRGSETLLLIRNFSENPGVADSQQFTKITGIMRKDRSSEKDELLVLAPKLSMGSSGFAYKGDYWLSRNPTVELRRMDERDGRVNVVVTALSTNDYRNEEKSISLQFTCRLRHARVDDLSAWEGGNGDLWLSLGPVE